MNVLHAAVLFNSGCHLVVNFGLDLIHLPKLSIVLGEDAANKEQRSQTCYIFGFFGKVKASLGRGGLGLGCNDQCRDLQKQHQFPVSFKLHI